MQVIYTVNFNNFFCPNSSRSAHYIPFDFFVSLAYKDGQFWKESIM